MSTAKQTHKTKKKFTTEEDMVIIREVSGNGECSWDKIARMFNGRNGRQIRERWVNYLSPNVSKKPWTDEEDKLLLKMVEKEGKKWSKIAKYFPSRTDVIIKNRWTLLKRRSDKKAKASSEKGDIISSESAKIISDIETIDILDNDIESEKARGDFWLIDM